VTLIVPFGVGAQGRVARKVTKFLTELCRKMALVVLFCVVLTSLVRIQFPRIFFLEDFPELHHLEGYKRVQLAPDSWSWGRQWGENQVVRNLGQ
jgi:hypothetical protein